LSFVLIVFSVAEEMSFAPQALKMAGIGNVQGILRMDGNEVIAALQMSFVASLVKPLIFRQETICSA
jgi:hypothetical protein